MHHDKSSDEGKEAVVAGSHAHPHALLPVNISQKPAAVKGPMMHATASADASLSHNNRMLLPMPSPIPLKGSAAAAVQSPRGSQLSAPGPKRPLVRAHTAEGVPSSRHASTSSNEFSLAAEPSPILANPTNGLSSLSEALAHFVASEQNGSTAHEAAMIRSPGIVTAGSSSRSSTVLSHETGATSPDGKSQIAGLKSPTAAAALIAKASRHGTRLRGASSRADSPAAAEGPSREHSKKTAPESNTASSSASGSRPTSALGTSAAAALPKASTGETPPSEPSSGNGSPRNSSRSTSGMTTPISGSTSKAGTASRFKPKVLETHHLQLQTHAPSGRRMINQYVIENELGRGVHGKVRLARNAETGERVAVKIVEREGKKRLGGNSDARTPRLSKAKENAHDTGTDDEQKHFSFFQDAQGNGTGPSTPLAHESISGLHAHFADSSKTRVGRRQPSSPTMAIGGARFGRWGEGQSSRPTYADLELERQREKEREQARKRLLWTTDQKVKREIAIMKKCAHENVVRLKEVIDDPHSKKIFMVLEYMEGGEVRWKDDRGFPTLTVDDARRALRDVVLGLEYLHYQGIIHRDIKPANLLCGADKRVKISDFGVSHFSFALLVASGGLPSQNDDSDNRQDANYVDDRELAKTAGSPAFFAPELCLAGDMSNLPAHVSNFGKQRNGSIVGIDAVYELPAGMPAPETALANDRQRRPPITKAIDIWALGVTLYCLLFGHVPFSADSEYALFSVIAKEDYELPAFMGADRVLVGPRRKRWACLDLWTDEEGDVDRSSAAECESDVDPFLLSEEALLVRDLLDRLLEKDPSKRIKLDEVKKHPWLVQDIADPPAWLKRTDPTHLPSVQVSHEEVQDALTGFSKFKQTIKRFQSKLLTAFGGHSMSPEASREHQQREHLYDRKKQDHLPIRRHRSKSASQVDKDALAILRDVSQAHHPHAISADNSHRTSPMTTLNHRPRRTFGRRHSAILGAPSDAGADDKSKPPKADTYNEGMFAVSQPGSCSSSRQGSIRTGKFGSDAAKRPEPKEADFPLDKLSGEAKVKKRPQFFSRRATSRDNRSEVDAQRSLHHGHSLFTRGSHQTRPSSRASTRDIDDENAATATSTPMQGSGGPDKREWGDALQSREKSLRHPSSSSPQRSRTRLSDVFRHVWTAPHHRSQNHVGGSERIAAGRSDIALNRGVTLMDGKENPDNMGGPRQRIAEGPNSSAHVSPSASVHARQEFDDISKAADVAGGAEAQGAPFDGSHHRQSRDVKPAVIGVDEYDVDLDLSDDESVEGEHRRGGGSGGESRPLLHMNGSGWLDGTILRPSPHASRGSDSASISSSAGNSLTPSVEGGYNIFKPAYIGRGDAPVVTPSTQLAEQVTISSSHGAQPASLHAFDVGDSAEAAALRRGSASGEASSGTMPLAPPLGAANIPADVMDASIISDDRFADADEGGLSVISADAPYQFEALSENQRSYAPRPSPYHEDPVSEEDWCTQGSGGDGGGSRHSWMGAGGTHGGVGVDDDGPDDDGFSFKARRSGHA